MEVLIRPVMYGFYEAANTDAVSCTYDMEVLTPMSAVLSQLGLDHEHFSKCAYMHAGEKFRVISHGDEKPFVITTTKTKRWESEPNATEQILNTADAERCESLCMTHFAFIVGAFPVAAFTQFLQQVEQARNQTQLKRVVVDVDERHLGVANAAYMRVKVEVAELGKQ